MDTPSLPRLLDTILKQFVSDLGVSSWKIFGGNSDFATVTIRFGHHSLNQPQTSPSEAFRRRPPSAQDRDRQRIEHYHSRHPPNQVNATAIATAFNVESFTEFQPGAPMHGHSRSCSDLPAEVDMSRSFGKPLFTNGMKGLNESAAANDSCVIVTDPVIAETGNDETKDLQPNDKNILEQDYSEDIDDTSTSSSYMTDTAIVHGFPCKGCSDNTLMTGTSAQSVVPQMITMMFAMTVSQIHTMQNILSIW